MMSLVFPKTNVGIIYIGIIEDTKICFQDFLTFNNFKKISLNQTVCTHIHSRHTYNIYLYQHDGRENLIGSLQTSF